MHEEVVHHHATIDAQVGKINTRVLFHGLNHYKNLECCRLKHGARNVSLVDVAGEAGDHPTRAVLPVRRVEAAEGRHKVHAAIIVDRLCQ